MLARNFTALLQEANVKIFNESNIVLDGENVTKLLSKYNATQILEILRGFNDTINAYISGQKVNATLRFYGVLIDQALLKALAHR